MSEHKRASECSTRLRDLQSTWWRELIGKNYAEATKLADQIVDTAIALRRATFVEMDNAAQPATPQPDQNS